MKLLIVSHTAHYESDGKVFGWGPTVREIDALAEIFDEVRHVAPRHPGPVPPSFLSYERPNVRLVPVRAAGGTSLRHKLEAAAAVPAYMGTVREQLAWADAVHVRCPAGISLLAVVALIAARRPDRRWIKYAGNWAPSRGEPWSYRLQRWLLKRSWHRAAVTVNGSWPGQPRHVRSFLNPCLTDAELAEGAAAGNRKPPPPELRLLFVGRVESEKGVGRALEILQRLDAGGVPTVLDLVGDGREAPAFRARAGELGLSGRVVFHGPLPRAEIARLYSRAHVILLPSTASEGWPKVLSEAMAYGAVPVASDVSAIPQYLARFAVGHAIAAGDVDRFAEVLAQYAREPERWRAESVRARVAAAEFSYRRYLAAVRNLPELRIA